MAKGFREPGEKPRRFYKIAAVAKIEGGWTVQLDGRGLRTPSGPPLVLPFRALAEMAAREWMSQGETIEMAEMHATRLANTAIDTIAPTRAAVADQIADYAGSDLLCYFAEGPTALLERQQAQWGPLLARAEADEGLTLTRAVGIVHRRQPAATLERVRDIALSLDDFALAGLAFATALYGSAVLSVAVLRGWLSGEAAFDLSRLDEDFQEEQWGIDVEAAERAERQRAEARMVGLWLTARE